jgi:ElaB/YqjD/DUF883 family membrane-anchored ribosome-binding protein
MRFLCKKHKFVFYLNPLKIHIMSDEIVKEESFFDKLKNKAEELADKAGDVWEDVKDKAEDAWEAAKDKAEDLKEKAEDKFEELTGKHDAEEVKDEAVKATDDSDTAPKA